MNALRESSRNMQYVGRSWLEFSQRKVISLEDSYHAIIYYVTAAPRRRVILASEISESSLTHARYEI